VVTWGSRGQHNTHNDVLVWFCVVCWFFVLLLLFG